MVVEELLQLLVGEVDAELLKAVVLPFFTFARAWACDTWYREGDRRRERG